MPFFQRTELSTIKVRNEFATGQAKCGACGLYTRCISPKMKFSGDGNKKILIVAEAPGEEEDKAGRHLVGQSGQQLMSVLNRMGINMRKDCWLTTALICRPPNNEIKDVNWIDYCRPNLLKTISLLNPEVIILLGGVPVHSLIGHIWKDSDIGGITRWAGFQIPSHLNAWVCPTYHPAYLLRMNDPALDLEYSRHLRAAIELAGGRPWEKLPHYEKQVECITAPTDAAHAIKAMASMTGPIAFDYETTCLKPESPHARIVSCSLSDGKRTIAYPWHGLAINETLSILKDPKRPKIASNLDMEDRWTRKMHGVQVQNWGWDTMLAAHTLDSRSLITSIKFQSFVLLGQPSYDDHIRPYLEGQAKGGNSKNRIHEIDLNSLLLYNGLDSLLEYHVALKQRKQIQRGFL